MIPRTTHTRAELIEHLDGPDPRTTWSRGPGFWRRRIAIQTREPEARTGRHGDRHCAAGEGPRS